ncbi:KilA-N domain-containing protein, partial [Bacteroides pyogenes]|uniref:KilA-N domain-containing protein n=1 Tax=Bacteroides pyogenes TaxID=310300 RepID=UPI001BAD7072
MKTNQEMVRKMGTFSVIQRTKDGYFNATELLKQWNNENEKEQRRLDKFWDVTNLDKLMAEIAENELNFKSPNFGELKNALSKSIRGKKNGGTWMHPVLFIKFAMYLSPRFEYHVLKFVSDEMIKYRNEA